MTEGEKEAATLIATLVNNLAVGTAVTGGIAPVFAYLNGTLTARVAFWQLSGASVVYHLAAVTLPVAARRYLKKELSR